MHVFDETIEPVVDTNVAVLKDDPSSCGTKAFCFGAGDTLKLTVAGSHNWIHSIRLYPSKAVELSDRFADGSVVPAGGVEIVFAARQQGRLVGGKRIRDGESARSVPLLGVWWEENPKPGWIRLGNLETNDPMDPDCMYFKVKVKHDWHHHHFTYILDPELVNTGSSKSEGVWEPVGATESLAELTVD